MDEVSCSISFLCVTPANLAVFKLHLRHLWKRSNLFLLDKFLIFWISLLVSPEQMGWTHLEQELQLIHSIYDFFLLPVCLKTGAIASWLPQIEQTQLQSLSKQVLQMFFVIILNIFSYISLQLSKNDFVHKKPKLKVMF